MNNNDRGGVKIPPTKMVTTPDSHTFDNFAYIMMTIFIGVGIYYSLYLAAEKTAKDDAIHLKVEVAQPQLEVGSSLKCTTYVRQRIVFKTMILTQETVCN